MLIPLTDELPQGQDLVHQARRFRVVLNHFNTNLGLIFPDLQPPAHVDAVAFAAAFTGWREAFDQARPLAAVNREDFVLCAAGLMLKHLVLARPFSLPAGNTALNLPQGASPWPEGYAYTNFCVAMALGVLKDMGSKMAVMQARADDPTFWASFRENVNENASLAPAFLDLLFGQEPNWAGPDIAAFRPAMRDWGFGPRDAAETGPQFH